MSHSKNIIPSDLETKIITGGINFSPLFDLLLFAFEEDNESS
jgi:hypothetical protein